MNNPLLIVFLLGFSSGLPQALLTSTLQAWFASSGLSVLTTGCISLIGLPYAYRMFWAPLLDRYYKPHWGRRRTWLFITQIALLLGFCLMGLFSPDQRPLTLIFFAFFLAFFSATQDAVIDAQRVESLPLQYHALGASLAVSAYRIALFIGGGLALIIANLWGFSLAYVSMAGLMFLGLGASFFLQEEPLPKTSEPVLFYQSFVKPFKELSKRKGFVALVFFILFYKLGEAFTTTTSGIIMPFLVQGLNFPLDTIAYVNKILGLSSVLIGGILAGFVLLRYPLYPALFFFGLLQAVANLLFLSLAITGKNLMLFSLAVFADNFAAGLGSTALVALFMRLVDKRFTATQFSFLVAIASLPRIFSGPLGGYLQLKLGWIGLYQLAFVLSFAFIPFMFCLKSQVKLKCLV